MRRKSTLALRVLEIIGEAAVNTVNILEAVVTSPYGSSQFTLQRNLSRIQRKRRRTTLRAEEARRFHNLLYFLRRDGLIEKRTKEKRGAWTLTEKGNEELTALKNYYAHFIHRKRYSSVPSSQTTIIAFDIPEQHRRKRVWLRHALTDLGFTMLQKSVWIGTKRLPEDFIHDLRASDLIPHIEIFTITKAGSLTRLE